MSLPFDDQDAPLYAVSQVAEMLGVQPAFLRRLDNNHVVSPARSGGDQRRYSQTDIRLVQKVVGLVADGHTLVGIRRVLALEQQVRALQAQVALLTGPDPIASVHSSATKQS